MLVELCGILLIFPTLCYSKGEYSEMRELYTSILQNYNTDLVPVINKGRSLQVNASAYIMALTQLDEKSQTLISTLFLHFQWRDEMLKWDNTNFSHIDSLLINAKRVWLPGLFLVNTIDDMQLRKSEKDYFVKVQSNGVTQWFPAAELRTSCTVDLTYYPFDTQTCKIRMEAWYQDSNELLMNVTGKGIYISSAHFVENGEWAIENLTASAYCFADYELNETFYSGVEYTIVLSRRYSYHLLTTAFPFMVLVTLNLLAMIIPTDSSEKLSFCMSLFLTMIVFLTLIAQNMPSSSFFISYLTFLVGLQILVSGLTISVIAVCIYTKRKDQNEIPPCLVRIIFGPLQTCQYVFGTIRYSKDARNNGRIQQMSWKDIENKLENVLKVIIILSFTTTIITLAIVSQ